jgi:TPR repeat protein
MCYVGECYLNGVGATKDMELARLWFTRALEDNVPKVAERARELLRRME